MNYNRYIPSGYKIADDIYYNKSNNGMIVITTFCTDDFAQVDILEWVSQDSNKNSFRHREDGPAYIELRDGVVLSVQWYINDKKIAWEVMNWIKENDYPNWQEWDDAIKLHFKLTFIG